MKELLAAYTHDTWSGWMKYLFKKSVLSDEGAYIIPKNLVDRWTRQMKTMYEDLPEHEKESDRKEAETILSIIETGKYGP